MVTVSTLKEVEERRKSGKVTDFTKGGKCSRCGGCCSNYLPLTKNEIAVIKRYIKKNNITPSKNVFPYTTPTYDMTCPFLDNSSKEAVCRIYDVRPGICRVFTCADKTETTKYSIENHSKLTIVNVKNTFFT